MKGRLVSEEWEREWEREWECEWEWEWEWEWEAPSSTQAKEAEAGPFPAAFSPFPPPAGARAVSAPARARAAPGARLGSAFRVPHSAFRVFRAAFRALGHFGSALCGARPHRGVDRAPAPRARSRSIPPLRRGGRWCTDDGVPTMVYRRWCTDDVIVYIIILMHTYRPSTTGLSHDNFRKHRRTHAQHVTPGGPALCDKAPLSGPLIASDWQ